jgi:hypothetical protein
LAKGDDVWVIQKPLMDICLHIVHMHTSSANLIHTPNTKQQQEKNHEPQSSAPSTPPH